MAIPGPLIHSPAPGNKIQRYKWIRSFTLGGVERGKKDVLKVAGHPRLEKNSLKLSYTEQKVFLEIANAKIKSTTLVSPKMKRKTNRQKKKDAVVGD